jgi:hypothetical protein
MFRAALGCVKRGTVKKPRSNRPAPRAGESTPLPARVLIFPCLVQLPRGRASRPAAVGADAEDGRFQLELDNGGPGDAPRSRAGSGR